MTFLNGDKARVVPGSRCPGLVRCLHLMFTVRVGVYESIRHRLKQVSGLQRHHPPIYLPVCQCVHQLALCDRKCRDVLCALPVASVFLSFNAVKGMVVCDAGLSCGETRRCRSINNGKHPDDIMTLIDSDEATVVSVFAVRETCKASSISPTSHTSRAPYSWFPPQSPYNPLSSSLQPPPPHHQAWPPRHPIPRQQRTHP